MFTFKDDLTVVLAGEAGQGIQTIEALLTQLLKRGGYHVFATKEYMSRVRGGDKFHNDQDRLPQGNRAPRKDRYPRPSA